MARIRTVKPEFFDDEKLATISLSARLVFIGLLVQSDDYGVVKGHPLWLKNQILPYDDISVLDFVGLLDELQRIACIVPFLYNGEQFFHIRTFAEHQKVEKPSKWRNPAYIADTPRLLPDYSPTTPLPVGRKSATLPAVKDRIGSSKGIVKAMEGEYEGKPNQPVDNFPSCPAFPVIDDEKENSAFEKQPGDGEDKSELQELVNKVKVKHPKFPVESWYGKNMRCHPEAICHVLRSLLKVDMHQEGKEYTYIQKALDVENGKYNSRDWDREEVVKKRDRAGSMESFGAVMARIAEKGAG